MFVAIAADASRMDRGLSDRYTFVREKFAHIGDAAPVYARIPSHWESSTGTPLCQQKNQQKEGETEREREKRMRDRGSFVANKVGAKSSLITHSSMGGGIVTHGTGQSYDAAHCPYSHAFTMFNHQNVWMNVQRTDAPLRYHY